MSPSDSESHHLSNSEFLSSLTALFTSTHARSHGSVFITQKPLSSDPRTRLLIRATDGRSPTAHDSAARGGKGEKVRRKGGEKVKISTVVDLGGPAAGKRAEEESGEAETDSGKAAEEFFGRFTEVCKKGMVEGMRKRDRRKKGKRERRKRGEREKNKGKGKGKGEGKGQDQAGGKKG